MFAGIYGVMGLGRGRMWWVRLASWWLLQLDLRFKYVWFGEADVGGCIDVREGHPEFVCEESGM